MEELRLKGSLASEGPSIAGENAYDSVEFAIAWNLLDNSFRSRMIKVSFIFG